MGTIQDGSVGQIRDWRQWLDLTTGGLSPIAGISVAGSDGEFDQNGKYLFRFSSSQGKPTGFDACDESASAALTTPLASVGWARGAWGRRWATPLGCEG